MPSHEYQELDEEFPEVARLLRGQLPEVPREKPSEELWQQIIGRVRADAGGPPARPLESTDGAHIAPQESSNGAHIAPQLNAPPTEGTAPGVIDLTSARTARRGPRWGGFIAAAAALALVVPAALFALGRPSTPDASTELVALASQSGVGAAELRDRTLSVDINTGSAPDGSFYEVWLLEIDASNELLDLRSLGRIDGDADFAIPEGLDLERFAVVDVSLEADDGNPDHSGDSVLRGVLG